MAFLDLYNFENLSNEAERIVIEELGSQLEKLPDDAVCKCNDCVMDMAAMALNSVKPLYRCSLLGTLYTAEAMQDGSYAHSIKKAVSSAVTKVTMNPSHAV
ncbi:MAG: hypothetical protein Ta2G_11920 [Termitinemataceae bacterium]|nr:MAG: hypothetical protein Ta2G_11920 [Termitinemataceae bacterium]